MSANSSVILRLSFAHPSVVVRTGGTGETGGTSGTAGRNEKAGKVEKAGR